MATRNCYALGLGKNCGSTSLGYMELALHSQEMLSSPGNMVSSWLKASQLCLSERMSLESRFVRTEQFIARDGRNSHCSIELLKSLSTMSTE